MRPPTPREAWLRLAACAGAAALLQMDGTIVTVALPSVGEELGADSHQLSYVLTAYFIAYGLALFPGGALVDRIGSRTVGLAGLAVFAAGALIGALAGSLEVLIVSRLVQGVGAGLVSPASLAGAVSGFSPERRGAALGIWGASSGIANLIGPLVGGLLTVAIDWRACWWFLVPVAGLVAWGVIRFVPPEVHADERPEAAGLRQRVVGAAALVVGLTFAVMIGAFFLAQQYLQQQAGYSALGAAAALALWQLVPREVHADESPETSGLRQRVVAAAALVAALTFAVMIGAFYLGQQYLQISADYSALGAAAALTLIALVVVVAAPVSGRLTDSRGEGRTAALGFLLVALALGVLAIPGVPLDGLGALPPLVPFGLGLGLLFVPASRAALNAVPQAKHGRVSSLLSVSRLLGAGLGAVLGGVALSGGVTEDHMRIALGAGAALCLVVGLPAAAELSNRSASTTIESRRPGSRGGAASPASRSRR